MLERVTDYLHLLFLNIVFKGRLALEFIRTFRFYVRHPRFARIDLALIGRYLFRSPYRISKEFLQKQGAEEVYAYGETPLTTWEKIAAEAGLTDDDTLFELGSGRGRGCFWLHYFVGCRVIGIEYIPEFVETAQRLVKHYGLKGVSFREEDMAKTKLDGATVIYLCGTCFDDPFIKKLIRHFVKLPKGTRIITVSYPLSDFTDRDSFHLEKTFTASFTWSDADVYIQRR